MDRRWADLRYSLRSLRRAPGFTAISVLTLALGIGAVTAVFAVADAALLRPFPYPDMTRIVLLGEVAADGGPMSVAFPNFEDWKTQNAAFTEIGVFRTQTATITGAGDPERMSVSLASSSVFTTMGIAPLMGRVFGAAEDTPGISPVVLISERLWRSHFTARPDVVGQLIVLDNQTYSIVGVMPARMRFPSPITDAWLPLGMFIRTFPPRDAHPGLQGIARLKPGTSIDAARASMAAIARRLAVEYPASNKGNSVSVTAYYDSIVQGARPVLFMLLGAVGLLLTLTCTNLAGLMLARFEGRQREFTVRAAIGGSRRRLMSQVLTESVLLASAGGALGLGLAAFALRAFAATRPTSVPRVDLLTIDWRIAGFALAVTGATALLCGLLPARHASAPDLQTALKDARAVGGSGRTPFRHALVVAQVAITVVLLVGAGLVAKSLHRLLDVDLGFVPDRVLTMRVALPAASYPTLPAWVQFHEQLVSRLVSLPDVDAVGLNSAVPLAGGAAESRVFKEGDPLPSPTTRPGVVSTFESASDDYFKAMGIAVIAGRTFSSRDTPTSPHVAVVDDVIVEKLFNGANPVGRRICFEASGEGMALTAIWREVIGVVSHVKQYAIAGGPPYGQVYTSYTQLPNWMGARRPAMAVVVRSANADAVVSAVRRAVASLDPRLPVYNVQTMNGYVSQQVEQPRLGATLLVGFGGIALLLSAIGIYGLLSHIVSRRIRDIGVRLALGAEPSDALQQVLGQALGLTSVGLAIGLGAAIALTRSLRSLLFGVSPTDFGILAAAALVLAAVALVAGLAPGLRASRVDPIVALRTD